MKACHVRARRDGRCKSANAAVRAAGVHHDHLHAGPARAGRFPGGETARWARTPCWNRRQHGVASTGVAAYPRPACACSPIPRWTCTAWNWCRYCWCWPARCFVEDGVVFGQATSPTSKTLLEVCAPASCRRVFAPRCPVLDPGQCSGAPRHGVTALLIERARRLRRTVSVRARPLLHSLPWLGG